MTKLAMSKGTQFSVIVKNIAGSLAKVAKVVADEGVNLKGICMTDPGDGGDWTVRLVTSQVDDAKKALDANNYEYTVEELHAVMTTDRPGFLAKVADELGSAGINILCLYLTSPGALKDTVMYVGVGPEDFDKAGEILKHLED